MPKNLLIVESPAKAKTIEKYLGKDFKVVSSYGHIRDLPGGELAVDVENNYSPKYVISKDKEKTVKDLKKIAKEAEEIWLATDEDREGEAISWHLCEVLGLDPAITKRIVFHEITKPAIQKAIEEPRKVDLKLVYAQQARRILDRLVGFKVSPILWRKVSLKNALSAGRVQSVAVRLIVEREREINAFTPVVSFKVEAFFTLKGPDGKPAILKAALPTNLKTAQEVEDFLAACSRSVFSIKDIDVKPAKKTPAAPFTTSTLQQEASRKLSFSVSRTMTVAQKLYENGHITYMRTDSVNLSDTAKQGAAEAIKQQFGPEYHKARNYANKSAGAQEAHEAIRPTDMMSKVAGSGRDEQRLYDLIWKRTLASQMADAQLERTNVHIGISEVEQQLTAKGEVIKFDGFLKVYFESTDEESDDETTDMLPPLTVGQELTLKEMLATQKFTRHPARYTEASLVKKLEELGIGRPSTYAPTISTVQKRGYIVKEDRPGVERNYVQYVLPAGGSAQKTELKEMAGTEKNKLFPTDVGLLVTDFLLAHFPGIMDYHFTAEVEKEFDDIADGHKKWEKMIDNFYQPFEVNVKKTLEEAERVTGERELGEDPKTGKVVIARMGKYGPMAQIGSQDDEEKQFAKLRPNQSIETITLEEALELFKLPRTLGELDGEEIVANEGRYGPYLRYKGKFYSLKEHDPLEISLEEAVPWLKEQVEAAKKKEIKVFADQGIQILNGPYGPYIKKEKRNFKIPKDKEAEALTLEECEEIIANAPAKKAGGRKRNTRKK